MKNYYEILEVDKNASQEVLEKAYRTLAKKYHPDLQQGEQKQAYAEKMKIINEAYDILSDQLKRERYNQKLENERIEEERIRFQQMQNEAFIREQQENYNDNPITNMSRVLNEEINVARRQAYYDAYIQDMKNRGYKIKYKHNFKYYLKLIGMLAITVFICFLIYQIPPVKNYFTDLYNNNVIFKAIVDIFKNTLSAKF